MYRASAIVVALLLVGCQAEPHRPSFLARSLQDCRDGDQAACAMIDALVAKADETETAEVTSPDQAQVEKNVQAIMKGIDRAGSSQPVHLLHLAPTSSMVKSESP